MMQVQQMMLLMMQLGSLLQLLMLQLILITPLQIQVLLSLLQLLTTTAITPLFFSEIMLVFLDAHTLCLTSVEHADQLLVFGAIPVGTIFF